MNLAEFLLARITEDESAAREIPAGSWEDACSATQRHEHVFRWSPARVLAECEAKRRIMGLAAESTALDMQVDGEFRVGARDEISEPFVGDLILRALALPYADHPEFREEWRP